MKLAETVTFGGSALERAGELRGSADAIAARWADPKGRVVPIWRGKPLFAGEFAAWLEIDHPVFDHCAEAAIFLGIDAGAPRFAMNVSGWEPEEKPDTLGAFFDPSEQIFPGMPEAHVFAELRGRMTRITARDAEFLAMARGMLEWHRTHRFCARCGAKSILSMAGWQRDCTDCGAKHFPRTDPVVIMLITRGNSVLIGRSHGWPEGMYSLLAGFVEPGEPIEAAVRREIFEESGIRVGQVTYLASQPWPFPNSLMIGCHGEALTNDITVDPVELDDAIWLTREEVMEAIAGNHAVVKPARNGSIARFLLVNWLADRLD